MSWSFPAGWAGKLSSSKQRWYYWKVNDPEHTVTWHPPSWNDIIIDNIIKTEHSTELYQSCQAFVQSALLQLWLQFEKKDKVLELGCGTGKDVINLPLFVTYCGIDIAEKSLEEAKQQTKHRKHCTFYTADFTLETLLNKQIKGTFTKAFSFYSFHYAGEAFDTALKSVASVLKPKSKFLFFVFDASIEERYPKGFGPLKIDAWETRDVGKQGKAHSTKRIWVSNTPEPILSVDQVYEACKAANFIVLKTELCGAAVKQLKDFAETTDQHELRDKLTEIQSGYESALHWDSLHWEFTNCFRAWLLEKQ